MLILARGFLEEVQACRRHRSSVVTMAFNTSVYVYKANKRQIRFMVMILNITEPLHSSLPDTMVTVLFLSEKQNTQGIIVVTFYPEF